MDLYTAAAGCASLAELKAVPRTADVAAADAEGRTALFIAGRAGRLDMVEHLVEDRGASVDKLAGGQLGSALHAASENGHLPVVRYLVETAGATVDLGEAEGGRSALYKSLSLIHI